MHHALGNKNNPARLLFPGPKLLKTTGKMTRRQINAITPINRKIAEDPEQLETVTAIVNRTAGDVPFVVFGP
jgi:helicase MOV-10